MYERDKRAKYWQAAISPHGDISVAFSRYEALVKADKKEAVMDRKMNEIRANKEAREKGSA